MEYRKAMKIKWVLAQQNTSKLTAEGLVAKQNPSDVEVVSGATNAHTILLNMQTN